MMPVSPGRFIVLEGIDGCGSTTQAELLVRRLEARGERVHPTSEPSRGPVGALIRQALGRRLVHPVSLESHAFGWESMALLFAADRMDHVASEILPALAAGQAVVSDRYDLSSLAYQSVTAPPGMAALPWIRALNQRAPRPDLTLVIDVSAEVGEQRRRSRGGREEIFERRELQRRLARVYAKAEELVAGDRLVHVPGEGSIDEVEELIWHAVEAAAPSAGRAPR
jgi:dTMP kinase